MKLRTELPLGWRVHAGLVALVVPVLLLVVPLHRLTAFMGRRTLPDGVRHDRLAADWVDNLMHRFRGPWRHTCLRRCAVLYHLLHDEVNHIVLCVGVKRENAGALEAHAWLALNGAPYLEPRGEVQQEFSVIARFPEGAAAQ
jgi:hypothetical protein